MNSTITNPSRRTSAISPTAAESRNRNNGKAAGPGLAEARRIRRLYRRWLASRMPRPAVIPTTSPKALREAMIPVLAEQVARKEAG